MHGGAHKTLEDCTFLPLPAALLIERFCPPVRIGVPQQHPCCLQLRCWCCPGRVDVGCMQLRQLRHPAFDVGAGGILCIRTATVVKAVHDVWRQRHVGCCAVAGVLCCGWAGTSAGRLQQPACNCRGLANAGAAPHTGTK